MFAGLYQACIYIQRVLLDVVKTAKVRVESLLVVQLVIDQLRFLPQNECCNVPAPLLQWIVSIFLLQGFVLGLVF